MADLDANPYVGLFKAAGAKYGIDYRLLEAMAKQESGFNPKAGSKAGAQGLMQFMPGTAKSWGVNPWDPGSSIDGAARYIKAALGKYNGNVEMALASYNSGFGNVDKYHGVPPFKETQGYVRSIMAMMGGKVSTSGGGGGGGSGNPLQDAIDYVNGQNFAAAVAAGEAAKNGGKMPGAPYKLPAGGTLISVNGGQYPHVIYPVTFGVWLEYDLTPGANYDFSGLARFDTSLANYDAQFRPNMIKGGDAAELDSVAKNYGSFDKFWTWILDSHLGPNAEARNDPGVLKVMAQLAGRPDMSDTELENLLRMTDYWKGRTEGQTEWNDLSPAEQNKRIQDVSAQLRDQFFQLVGSEISNDQGGPYGIYGWKEKNHEHLDWWAIQVASGAKGLNEAVQVWIKPEAQKVPESPWNRTIRSEEENQNQRRVDIENQSGKVVEMANQWGVQLSGESVAKWGQDIVSKTKSDAEFLDYLKNQAKVLYPWKDREMDTRSAAEPWLQTYQRVMESQADLTNPNIQAALTEGQPVWQFEQKLKADPAWTETKNAQETMESMLGEVGRRFGFA